MSGIGAFEWLQTPTSRRQLVYNLNIYYTDACAAPMTVLSPFIGALLVP